MGLTASSMIPLSVSKSGSSHETYRFPKVFSNSSVVTNIEYAISLLYAIILAIILVHSFDKYFVMVHLRHRVLINILVDTVVTINNIIEGSRIL